MKLLGLHLSLEFSFKPVYPTMVVKNFKCMKTFHNSPPGSTITSQATMTWNIRLFIF